MKPALSALVLLFLISACSEQTEAPTPVNTARETGAEAAPPPESAQQPRLSPELAGWVREEYGEYGTPSYRFGEVDLDGDGNAETLIYIGGPGLCGTGGCTLAVFQHTGQGPDLIGRISVARLPVGVFSSSTNGWRDLAVTVGGGGLESGAARVPFGDNSYAGNPTVAPAEITTDEFTTVIEMGEMQPLD